MLQIKIAVAPDFVCGLGPKSVEIRFLHLWDDEILPVAKFVTIDSYNDDMVFHYQDVTDGEPEQLYGYAVDWDAAYESLKENSPQKYQSLQECLSQMQITLPYLIFGITLASIQG